MRDLGSLGGFFAMPYGVNSSGDIAGLSYLGDDTTIRAFRWTAADGMVALQTEEGSNSNAYGIAEDGSILGTSEDVPGNFVAVVWSFGTITPIGSNVSLTFSAPSGEVAATVVFDNISEPGSTAFDPAEESSLAPPPGGFLVTEPPLIFDISTSAEFTGSVTVCLPLPTPLAGTPRLFHFEGDVWVDITSTIEADRLCGLASSLSPFAIFVSPVRREGFLSPVSSEPGFVNTAKAGSTVPLKFRVFVGDSEVTSTQGLSFGVWRVGCDSGSTEEQVPFATTGASSLRYAGGSFIQNWKTPTAAGCYQVRMVTEFDGLSIVGTFKLR
jgi:hypothetical protein